MIVQERQRREELAEHDLGVADRRGVEQHHRVVLALLREQPERSSTPQNVGMPLAK